jgi:hypothetical protein
MKIASFFLAILMASSGRAQQSGTRGVPGGGITAPGFLPQSIFAGPYLTYFNDFITGSDVATNQIGGSGGTCTVNTTYADVNHPGQILLTSPATNGQGVTCGTQSESASLVSPNNATNTWTWETAVDVPVLPGTTAASYQAGLSSSPNTNPWTTGVEFYLSSANSVANDWYCRYGSTSTDSGITAAATTWTRLSITNDGAYVHWYVNGTEAAGCRAPLTAMPSTNQYPASWAVVTLSSVAATMGVDYITLYRTLSR